MNSPSTLQDSSLTRDASSFTQSLLLHEDDNVPAIWKILLCHFHCCLLSPTVRFVPCTVLQHSVADPGDVTSNGVAGLVFGQAMGQEKIVVFPDCILTFEGSKSSSLVDRFQDPVAPR